MDGALEQALATGALGVARGPRPPISALEAALQHVFRDRSLLQRALTHVSALAQPRREDSNQRLEFLGDRVLGLAVADLLCDNYPKATEGELSRRLAALVRKESCAEAARAWGVGPHLRLGAGEGRSGGRDKEAILGDVCEALIGAVYLDGGYDAARELVRRTFLQDMREPRRSLRDPKSGLQEWAQARGLPPPVYRETARSGPDHAPCFRIAVSVEGFEPMETEGASKRLAEQAAAQRLLEAVVSGAALSRDEAASS